VGKETHNLSKETHNVTKETFYASKETHNITIETYNVSKKCRQRPVDKILQVKYQLALWGGYDE